MATLDIVITSDQVFSLAQSFIFILQSNSKFLKHGEIWHWIDFPNKNNTAPLNPWSPSICAVREAITGKKKDCKLKYYKDGKPMPTLNAFWFHAQPYQ